MAATLGLFDRARIADALSRPEAPLTMPSADPALPCWRSRPNAFAAAWLFAARAGGPFGVRSWMMTGNSPFGSAAMRACKWGATKVAGVAGLPVGGAARAGAVVAPRARATPTLARNLKRIFMSGVAHHNGDESSRERSAGSVKLKVLPFPGPGEDTEMRPPWALTIAWQMYSPRPLPSSRRAP